MLRLLLVIVCVQHAASDAILEPVILGGALPAAVCAGPAGRGCAGAVWARRWLLARASCLADLGYRAPVRLLQGPEDCPQFNSSTPLGLHAVVSFVHPGYSFPAIDDFEEPTTLQPLDAAMVLLSAPAPPTRADNHTATIALVPQLATWLRYVPLRGAARAHSPLRLALCAVLAPVAALLLAFLLLLRWPEQRGKDAAVEYEVLNNEPEA